VCTDQLQAQTPQQSIALGSSLEGNATPDVQNHVSE
jgi:hypothetical protein